MPLCTKESSPEILVLLEWVLQRDVRKPAASIRVFGVSAGGWLSRRRWTGFRGGVISVADELDGVEVVVAVLLVCHGRVRSLVGREAFRGHFLH